MALTPEQRIFTDINLALEDMKESLEEMKESGNKCEMGETLWQAVGFGQANARFDDVIDELPREKQESFLNRIISLREETENLFYEIGLRCGR